MKATAGDTHLGGEDFDNRVVDYFVQEFKRKHKKDMSRQPARPAPPAHGLRARQAHPVVLRTRPRIEIDSLADGVDFYAADHARALRGAQRGPVPQDAWTPSRRCLRDAKMNKADVNEIVLVGGSTRIPKVQQLLSGLLQRQGA